MVVRPRRLKYVPVNNDLHNKFDRTEFWMKALNAVVSKLEVNCERLSNFHNSVSSHLMTSIHVTKEIIEKY